MKIAIYGVGGVGGYFGGRLANAGHEVYYILRDSTYNILNNKPLCIKSIMGDFEITPKYVRYAKDVGQIDLLILAVKAWQIKDIVEDISSSIGSDTIILPLQNGVDTTELLTSIFGIERVLGGLCWIISYKEAPGVIRHKSGNPRLIFGSLSQNNKAALELYEVLKDIYGFETILSQDILIELWDKFIHIASASGVAAVTRSPVGVWRSLKQTRSMFFESMMEILILAQTKGIKVNFSSIEQSIDFVDKLDEMATFSMQRDIEAGLPSEIDHLVGSVVNMATKEGVLCCVNSFIYYSLLPAEKLARS